MTVKEKLDRYETLIRTCVISSKVYLIEERDIQKGQRRTVVNKDTRLILYENNL